MTRDPLDQLRAANPVPEPVAYADDEATRRIAEILAHDGQLPVSIGSAPDRRVGRARWLPAALVAAAVLVLAVVSAVVFTRGGHGGTDAAGSAPVTCAVSVDGGSKATAARIEQAEVAIRERMRQLGGSARSFLTDTGDGSVGFTPHGVSVRAAAAACRVSNIAIRPVVARPVAVDTRAPRSENPLAPLLFAIPSTDAGYARLTVAHRSQLTTAMSHFNCAPSSAPTIIGLACSTVTGPEQVLLLGPALITGPDVRSASATAPDTGRGGSSAQWTVALSFRAAGAARFQSFTGAHHTSSSTATVSDCGPTDPVPCADFLAITANGRILSVPLTNAVLDSGVSISGRFTESSAQSLAGELTAASVQLHPR